MGTLLLGRSELKGFCPEIFGFLGGTTKRQPRKIVIFGEFRPEFEKPGARNDPKVGDFSPK